MLTAPILVERGDEVVSMIRNPDHADEVAKTGARPLVADLEQLSVDELAAHMSGVDAVVWSAGAGGGNPDRTRAVDRDAAIRSMKAAERAGVSRYVMVSYFGSKPDHGVDLEHSFFPYADSKAAADEHLRHTDLAWTILGPSGLTLDPGTGKIDANAEESGTVSRENVAQVVAAVLADDSTTRRTIRFNDGQTPISTAVRG